MQSQRKIREYLLAWKKDSSEASENWFQIYAMRIEQTDKPTELIWIIKWQT